MRRFTARPKLGLFALVVLIGIALAISLAGASARSVPLVAWNAPNPTRDIRGGPARTVSGPARIAATKPLTLKPQQLFLTRAHSSVFNVRKLKSIVVKKERGEHEDPASPPARGVAPPPAKYFPSKLSKQQMVQKSVSPSTATPAADKSFDGLDFA